MGDEQNIKEQPNSIRKKHVGGIKSLLEVKNHFISLQANCFLIHGFVSTCLSVKSEIGSRNENESKFKTAACVCV